MTLNPGDRLMLSCPACHKPRALPIDIKEGDRFSLGPCGHFQCGRTFDGLLHDGQVEELIHAAA